MVNKTLELTCSLFHPLSFIPQLSVKSQEKEQEELWLQKEVIEFLRCASSTFFTAKRYEKLRAKAIKDGSRRKYKKSDVFAFVEYLQKSV